MRARINDMYWAFALAIMPLIPLCSLQPASRHGGTAGPLLTGNLARSDVCPTAEVL